MLHLYAVLKQLSQIFNKFFGKIEGITNRIAEIEGIRNSVMHSRMISDEDLEWLKKICDHGLRCIPDQKLSIETICRHDFLSK